MKVKLNKTIWCKFGVTFVQGKEYKAKILINGKTRITNKDGVSTLVHWDDIEEDFDE